ncbi:ubiquinol-cytochrome c reductase iron-sulfur subunit [Allomuricauda sp. F6463D]|uniref:QcrA and Rieske domain-containing protein n=1 Tax=Allomuricauda sp. F6463D TaxID=2926409 RepID=UPI001FF36828|nr:Rieske 2Fe-2S domain-containing protein [Muricauda sp. F6463D]MCK0160346.1 Rieske 2Fe-2S domain-containing protein [Muricauda sp. F6463D]
MERKEFLRSLGAGAAFALTFPCLQGCSKDGELETFPVSQGIDFTIDLNSQEAAPLDDNGGFISVKSSQNLKYLDVVIARNLEGNLIAASKICSHQGTEEIRFITEDGGVFHCSTHQSRFAQDGTSLNLSTTSNPLKIFNTELDGSILRVYE